MSRLKAESTETECRPAERTACAMSFKPVQRLGVISTHRSVVQVAVGAFAQNRQRIFFQYDKGYLETFGNPSPLTPRPTTELQRADREPHSGLHGFFFDGLADDRGLHSFPTRRSSD